MLKHLRSKTLMTVSFVFVFLFSMVGTAFAYGGTYTSTSSPSYDYVALGDSVPWGYQLGQSPGEYAFNLSTTGGVDLSSWGYPIQDPATLAGYFSGNPPTNAFYPSISRYPNLIADNLGVNLGSYTNLSMPGVTSKLLLATLTYHPDGTIVTVNGYNEQIPNYSYVRDSIAKSEIVTLTVGADDILTLPAVQAFMQNPTSSKALLAAQLAVLNQLPKTQANLVSIIAKIKLMNPKARIYVMGYYQAFYGNTAALNLIKLLNSTIKSSVNVYRYSLVSPRYVDTWNVVTVPDNLITNDIHVNPLGQAQIAAAFWQKISYDFHITP